MSEKKKDSRLKRAGVSGYNKPKRTPNHPTKSHVVVAKEGSKVKTIAGQQGKTGDKKMTKRTKSFKARHAKNIAKGKMSAAYWANKVKWYAHRGARTASQIARSLLDFLANPTPAKKDFDAYHGSPFDFDNFD